MELKSTLRVISENDYPGAPGVTQGQTYKRLVGCRKWSRQIVCGSGVPATFPALTNSCTGIRSRPVIT